MPDDTPTPPSSIRRLDTPAAVQLVRMVEAFDDLQTVLWCCERLVAAVSDGPAADEVSVEALWTLALLSYARAFTGTDDAPSAVTADDLASTQSEGKLPAAHQLLLHLRDHHGHASANPREVYTVGLAQDADGAVNAVAVTSVRTPPVDEPAVRQAGVLAYAMCSLLDERINELQKAILDEARDTSSADLAEMDLIEVAPTG